MSKYCIKTQAKLVSTLASCKDKLSFSLDSATISAFSRSRRSTAASSSLCYRPDPNPWIMSTRQRVMPASKATMAHPTLRQSLSNGYRHVETTNLIRWYLCWYIQVHPMFEGPMLTLCIVLIYLACGEIVLYILELSVHTRGWEAFCLCYSHQCLGSRSNKFNS